MDDYRSEGGHPCASYYTHRKQEEKLRDRLYVEFIDKSPWPSQKKKEKPSKKHRGRKPRTLEWSKKIDPEGQVIESDELSLIQIILLIAILAILFFKFGIIVW
ncbi:MAG: hypothetical protein GOU99_03435 [Candidatus Altiarchaeota archaeon]|nr:hypothetical protein [Candidatus Altiarchaeota archaeon]